jgi:hypothetical protein
MIAVIILAAILLMTAIGCINIIGQINRLDNKGLVSKSKPTYIYESPDKGKTIYRREAGNYNTKTKIKV